MTSDDNFPKVPIDYLFEWPDPDTIPTGWVLDEELTEFHQAQADTFKLLYNILEEMSPDNPLVLYPTTVIIRKVSD